MDILGNALLITLIVWAPLFLREINRRGLSVLLLWLLVGPIVTNLIRDSSANPFFQPQVEELPHDNTAPRNSGNLEKTSSITLKELTEPSRTLMIVFVGMFLFGVLTRNKTMPP